MSNDDDGHWQEYPPNLFIQALKDEEGDATTADITDNVGCSLETSRRKMHKLEDDGLVKSHKIGPVLVWQLV